jgi:hypothetical protein
MASVSGEPDGARHGAVGTGDQHTGGHGVGDHGTVDGRHPGGGDHHLVGGDLADPVPAVAVAKASMAPTT